MARGEFLAPLALMATGTGALAYSYPAESKDLFSLFAAATQDKCDSISTYDKVLTTVVVVGIATIILRALTARRHAAQNAPAAEPSGAQSLNDIRTGEVEEYDGGW